MKLQKALKLRKSLIGDITKLKQQINDKNSYIITRDNSGEILSTVKINVSDLYEKLLDKINQLIGLKYAINEANIEIQSKIYSLSEQKALIVFWNEVSVLEGAQAIGYSENIKEYGVQFDEIQRNKIVDELQKKVDAIQEEIDTYNYTTEIPWDEPEPQKEKPIIESKKK